MGLLAQGPGESDMDKKDSRHKKAAKSFQKTGTLPNVSEGSGATVTDSNTLEPVVWRTYGTYTPPAASSSVDVFRAPYKGALFYIDKASGQPVLILKKYVSGVSRNASTGDGETVAELTTASAADKMAQSTEAAKSSDVA